MSGLSKYLALQLFDSTLNPLRTALTPPPSLWLALHTSAPNDATYGAEASYGAYARQALNSLASDQDVQLGGGEVSVVVTNGAPLVFPASTGPSAQTITHWAIWDSETVGEGNVLYSGNIAQSRLVTVGDSVVVPEGNISLVIT
jgi:hypothetical protein